MNSLLGMLDYKATTLCYKSIGQPEMLSFHVTYIRSCFTKNANTVVLY